MGRCWTWYASIGGSTRPIPLSKGAGVWCISSHVTTTYHCWVVLCPLKMPLGKYVARHPRGCGMCVVPMLRQEKVNGLPRPIHSAIEIVPLAFDLNIRLVHTP